MLLLLERGCLGRRLRMLAARQASTSKKSMGACDSKYKKVCSTPGPLSVSKNESLSEFAECLLLHLDMADVALGSIGHCQYGAHHPRTAGLTRGSTGTLTSGPGKILQPGWWQKTV
jgi:hypothetical protein